MHLYEQLCRFCSIRDQNRKNPLSNLKNNATPPTKTNKKNEIKSHKHIQEKKTKKQEETL